MRPHLKSKTGDLHPSSTMTSARCAANRVMIDSVGEVLP
jgi:hypothetical protein